MFGKNWVCGRNCRLRRKLGVNRVLERPDCLLLQDIAGKEEKGCEYEDCFAVSSAFV